MGKPDEDREEVIRAAKAAHADSFIRRLPQGYDTVLTDDANMSVGQRQLMTIARAMITRYGMHEDFDMVAMEIVQNQYLGGDASLNCSQETAADIDRQVIELVRKQHEKAKQLLMENRDDLDRIAKYLYEKETITGEEFMKILNEDQVPETETESE